MANETYTPGVQNSPFGLRNTNAQGANYANDSAYTPEESNLIAKAIRYKLFDAAPEQYNSMKILFQKEVKDVMSDEFEFLEYTYGRSPMECVAGAQTTAAAAAVVAVPGNFVSHTFNVSAASLLRMAISNIITYPNGEEGVIVNITGNIVTVNSLTNVGLPGVAAGDVFALRSTIMADGQDQFDNYSRLETITRYNYVQLFLRASRWDRVEMIKFKNMGTTDYMDRDKEEKMRQLRLDMFISYWNGHRGEYTLSGTRVAKSMGGIYPTMIAAGSATSNPTVGGLAAAFENLAFNTNFKAEGATRFIYGTHEVLHELSKIYRVPGLRYRPEDKDVKLDLEMIEVGGAKYALVPCELFREPANFPADWARRLFILDQETIRPVKLKGLPMFEMNETDDISKGQKAFYKEWSVAGQLSMEFNNPLASFIIDVQ